MVHSSVAYCPCGAEIWIEYLPSGVGDTNGGWPIRFFDGDNHCIDVCPECRRQIKEEELDSR